MNYESYEKMRKTEYEKKLQAMNRVSTAQRLEAIASLKRKKHLQPNEGQVRAEIRRLFR